MNVIAGPDPRSHVLTNLKDKLLIEPTIHAKMGDPGSRPGWDASLICLLNLKSSLRTVICDLPSLFTGKDLPVADVQFKRVWEMPHRDGARPKSEPSDLVCSNNKKAPQLNGAPLGELEETMMLCCRTDLY